MPRIKLKEWADRNNLSYITANRHFHQGLIPGATQLDSGTILVEDDSLEQNMAANSSANDAMSLFLKKTVEFSKNNSTVEDFAAFVISNFQLKLNTVPEGPRYSRNKPKADEVQKHFQQFIPDKESVEHLKAVATLLKQGKIAGDVVPAASAPEAAATSPVDGLLNEEALQSLFVASPSAPTDIHAYTGVHMYGGESTEGLVSRSVDFSTPQQINYTGSTSQAFSSSSSIASAGAAVNSSQLVGGLPPNTNAVFLASAAGGSQTPVSFQPTQKEVLAAYYATEVAEAEETAELPRKRGRKPSKKR